MKKTIKDVVDSWPPSVWSAPYHPGEIIPSNLSNALIIDGGIENRNIILKVRENGKDVITTVTIIDTTAMDKLNELVSGAKGKTIIEFGNLSL